ncbi:MAG TPA: ATP-binding protein [Terriglobales bacterium]|nr:ATP-binding protein [Terriglobales bacterium]
MWTQPSLLRAFAVLSLVTVAAITTAQVAVQWALLRDDLLERERTQAAAALRREAYAAIQPDDFTTPETPEAQERFARLFERALLNPEVLRVKIYDRDGRIVWSDEPRLVGRRFADNARLQAALAGATSAYLERSGGAENVFEKELETTLELYVPLTFAPALAPGTARVSGVIEVYRDPARLMATLANGRRTILTVSLVGALVLYLALFWIVRGAARRLAAQQAALVRHAAALDAANRDLTAVQGQLRASERLAAVGEVSAAVAHGIRNPLANIRASAQVALDVAATGDSARYLGAITAEVDRLDRWLRALLDVVRPFAPRLAPVDVNALVEECAAILADRAAERGIALVRRGPDDLPTVVADEVQVQQAVLSVLENALDAVCAGGHVEVVTARAALAGAPAVTISVRDDGTGIPEERRGRIFEPFFTTKPRGTGLGLAITRKVMEGHGGHIAVESGPERGTVVTLTLPQAAQPVAA